MKTKQFMKRFLCVLLMLTLVFGITVPCEAASKAKLSKTSTTLCVGETLQLKLTGGSGKVTWSSNKKKVASVSKNGLVTAKKAGSCVITAKQGGKSYKCKITVKKLPKNYATVNGKKVKVGSTVKITYKLKSKKKIARISIKYVFDHDALEIVNLDDDASRFKTWVCNEYYPNSYDDNKEVCDIAHLVGVDPKDPYSIAALSCSKAKVVDNLKIKVSKSGNYKVSAEFYFVNTINDKEVKDYTVTETVK